MSEHHAFASLTPRLLARKGGAKPAMRRQDTSRFVNGGLPPQSEDLGWNDWGHGQDQKRDQVAEPVPTPAPKAVPTPAPAASMAEREVPEVMRQIEQIAWRINQAVVPHKPAALEGRRAAFTLRLDNERHFRLKMAGVVLNRSAQVLVTEALDKYLSEIPEIAQLHGSAKKQS
jgi:hypothetical protein